MLDTYNGSLVVVAIVKKEEYALQLIIIYLIVLFFFKITFPQKFPRKEKYLPEIVHIKYNEMKTPVSFFIFILLFKL